jgi:protein-S-isoprenylcysteine O-methyltransferase Ste14
MKPVDLDNRSWKVLENTSTQKHESRSKNLRLLINLVGLLITWSSWFWLIESSLFEPWYLWLAIGGVLILIPMIFLGRWILDHQPMIERAIWVTAMIHYLIAIFLGSAVIAAVRFAQAAPDWAFPLPSWLGLFLMAMSGLALVGGAVHLLNKGLGLPLGTEMTRQVVTNWIYAWTRNPIVLSSLAFLVGIGLWLGSGSFLLWVLALVFPAIFIFLLVFEERELEIRFGENYLEYKQKTPMLWPRRPKKDA